MRGFVTFLLAFALLALESPLLYHLHLSFYAPDFALLVVLYVGMTRATAPGVLLALALGLVKDGFALGSPIGLYMQVCVVVFLATRAVSSQLDLRPVALSIVAAFVASILASLLFLVLAVVFDRAFDGYGLVLKMMAPQALITAPFAPLLFLLLEKVDGVTMRRRSGTIFFH